MKKEIKPFDIIFPTSFEQRPVFEGGIFKNKKLKKLREFISFILVKCLTSLRQQF